MRNLTIDVWDPKSIEAAIKDLKKEKSFMKAKTRELIKRLGDIGVEQAQVQYNMPETQYAGLKDVRVKVKKRHSVNRHTATIIAGGRSVMFIEFGTGIFKSDDYEARDDIKSESGLTLHGMYGKQQGANYYGWFYSGDPQAYNPGDTERAKGRQHSMHTYGNEAMPVMYMTKKSLERQIAKIVREVFHD